MISVGIFINGKLIYKQSAHRVKDPDETGEATYKLYDKDKFIKHDPDKGAVVLARKLINEIPNDGIDDIKERLLNKLNIEP